MSDFMIVKRAVHEQMRCMVDNHTILFTTGVSKEQLWDTYLAEFRPGDNPRFRERTEHDCQCCKQFIRACGSLVAIQGDNTLMTIWDVEVDLVYQPVVDALARLVRSHEVRDRFLSRETHVGTDESHEMCDGSPVTTWPHFHFKLPSNLVSQAPGPIIGQARNDIDMLTRGVVEIREDALEQVLELIDGGLYRGEEFRQPVMSFLELVQQSKAVPQTTRCNWVCRTALAVGGLASFKNSVVGTLVVDLSEGMGLDAAAKRFESKVAPDNYKRTKSIATPQMINNARAKVDSLGLGNSLSRRYAVKDDITVDNVIFADNNFTTQPENIFDTLVKESAVFDTSKLRGVQEVPLDHFLEDILPLGSGLELLVESRMIPNMMSLIAPICGESPSLFKWDNGFSWAYAGDVADSLKDRVKAAGGKIDGYLRFSISWNESGHDNIDFDVHCYEPGNLIYYPSVGRTHTSSARLDVDMQRPGNKVGVENITWSDRSRMYSGEYEFQVHNYSNWCSKGGFTAEIEYAGEVHEFTYDKPLRGDEKVVVARADISPGEGLQFLKKLPSTKVQKMVWGVKTQSFCKVSLVLSSPNYWGDNAGGNKHAFFILEGCNSGVEARGFYNEFLRDDLYDDRKTFELLGSEMRVAKSPDQLSGVGFSISQRNHAYCRVSGRIFKVIF